MTFRSSFPMTLESESVFDTMENAKVAARLAHYVWPDRAKRVETHGEYTWCSLQSSDSRYQPDFKGFCPHTDLNACIAVEEAFLADNLFSVYVQEVMQRTERSQFPYHTDFMSVYFTPLPIRVKAMAATLDYKERHPK